MIDLTAVKSMGRETKAMVLILEYQARRMPMFQMRELLDLLASSPEDKIQIADMIGKNLISRGFPQEQIDAFLADLHVVLPAPQESAGNMENTRRMRQPFTQSFERPAASLDKPLAGRVSDGTSFIPRKPSNPDMPAVSVPPLSGAGGEGPSILPRISNSTMPPVKVPENIQNPPDTPTRPKSSAVLPVVGTPPASQSGFQRRTKFVFDTGAPPIPTPPKGMPSVTGGTPPSLPAVATLQTQPAAQPMVPPPSVEPPSGNRKPLVVLAEDDRRARMIFKLRLEEHGFGVIECPSGTEAWEHIQIGGIAAAVLDMKMPGMHGLEILKLMTQQKMTLPVVICTAYDQLEDEAVVKNYPMLRYLVKPIAPETIVMALRELLNQSPV